MNNKTPPGNNNRDLTRYAGLGTQILVALGLAVFAGLKGDKWLHTSPLLVGILPLLILVVIFYKLMRETAPRKSFGPNRQKMKNKKPWVPLLILFILLNCFFIVGKNWLLKEGIDHEVLIVGNLVLFLATALSFFVYRRSLKSANPQAAIRGMYGSFMIKFFVCLIAAFIYIMMAKKNVNKPALIICMVLYIVYTVIEVAVLQKLMKQKKAG